MSEKLTPNLPILHLEMYVHVHLQILDRCSLVTFAAYLPHKGEAYLFLEAPKGLPDKEKAGEYVIVRGSSVHLYNIFASQPS